MAVGTKKAIITSGDVLGVPSFSETTQLRAADVQVVEAAQEDMPEQARMYMWEYCATVIDRKLGGGGEIRPVVVMYADAPYPSKEMREAIQRAHHLAHPIFLRSEMKRDGVNNMDVSNPDAVKSE